MAEPTGNVSTPEDRWILLAPGTARLPERLLLAHCQGKVLFITGAGISRPSGLPDFRGLVLDIYKEVDPQTHAVMSALPADACNRGSPPTDTLSAEKRAEVNLFLRREYDVVLGMLERRIDRPGTRKTEVRNTLDRILRTVEDGSGTRAYAWLSSVSDTCRLRGASPLRTMAATIAAARKGMPPPALPPIPVRLCGWDALAAG